MCFNPQEDPPRRPKRPSNIGFHEFSSSPAVALNTALPIVKARSPFSPEVILEEGLREWLKGNAGRSGTKLLPQRIVHGHTEAREYRAALIANEEKV